MHDTYGNTTVSKSPCDTYGSSGTIYSALLAAQLISVQSGVASTLSTEAQSTDVAVLTNKFATDCSIPQIQCILVRRRSTPFDSSPSTSPHSRVVSTTLPALQDLPSVQVQVYFILLRSRKDKSTYPNYGTSINKQTCPLLMRRYCCR